MSRTDNMTVLSMREIPVKQQTRMLRREGTQRLAPIACDLGREIWVSRTGSRPDTVAMEA